jgi:hypothetical protein
MVGNAPISGRPQSAVQLRAYDPERTSSALVLAPGPHVWIGCSSQVRDVVRPGRIDLPDIRLETRGRTLEQLDDALARVSTGSVARAKRLG